MGDGGLDGEDVGSGKSVGDVDGVDVGFIVGSTDGICDGRAEGIIDGCVVAQLSHERRHLSSTFTLSNPNVRQNLVVRKTISLTFFVNQSHFLGICTPLTYV